MPAKSRSWQESLAVRCPTCHRTAKRKCISLDAGKPKRWAHPARVRAYQANSTKGLT